MSSDDKIPRHDDAQPGCILMLRDHNMTVNLARGDGKKRPPVRQYPDSHRYAPRGIFDHPLVVLQTNGDQIVFASLTTFGGVLLEHRFRNRRDRDQRLRQHMALAPTASHPLQGADGRYAPLHLRDKGHRRMRSGYVRVDQLYEIDRRYTKHWQDNHQDFDYVPELEAASLQRLLAVVKQMTKQNLARQPQQQLPNVVKAIPRQVQPVAQPISHPLSPVSLHPYRTRRMKWFSNNFHFPFQRGRENS